MAEEVLSAEHYVRELTRHDAVLCPAGNGLETFRTYEAWYCGVVPVVKHSHLAAHMAKHGLPLFPTPCLFDVGMNLLKVYSGSAPYRNADLSVLTKSYWRKRFEEARGEYL